MVVTLGGWFLSEHPHILVSHEINLVVCGYFENNKEQKQNRTIVDRESQSILQMIKVNNVSQTFCLSFTYLCMYFVVIENLFHELGSWKKSWGARPWVNQGSWPRLGLFLSPGLWERGEIDVGEKYKLQTLLMGLPSWFKSFTCINTCNFIATMWVR